MTTWYEVRTYKWNDEEWIRAVEVIRETDEYLILPDPWRDGKTSRRRKKGAADMFFPSWAEARAYLVEQARNGVERQRENLARAERKREEIEAIPEQEEDRG